MPSRAWLLVLLAGVVLAACGRTPLALPGDDAARPDAGTDVPAVDSWEPAPWLRDEQGGVLVLRGTNVASESKTTPDHLPPYGAADFAGLRDGLGLDAIRLLVFWQAVEPQAGRYDETYLAALRRVVQAAGAAQLRVLVDMHQDLYGEGFASTGAPRWTCDEARYASYRPPAEWYLGYFTPEVMACFDHLYGDAGVRASFAAAWARLARALRGTGAVLAYEVLNEPFWGSRTPRYFDTTIAPDLYAQVVDAIRREDPDPWVALEPATTASAGLASDLVLPARERLLYAPHLYPPALETGAGYDGRADALQRHVDRYRRDALRMGRPVVVGEVGARLGVPGAIRYLGDAYDALDHWMLGAFQWALGRGGGYDLLDRDGAPTDLARAIARPYPRRVAGIPRAWRWDADRGLFTCEWVEDGSARGDTEVALPALAFPRGADAQMADGGAVRIEGSLVRVPQVGGLRRLEVQRR